MLLFEITMTPQVMALGLRLQQSQIGTKKMSSFSITMITQNMGLGLRLSSRVGRTDRVYTITPP